MKARPLTISIRPELLKDLDAIAKTSGLGGLTRISRSSLITHFISRGVAAHLKSKRRIKK